MADIVVWLLSKDATFSQGNTLQWLKLSRINRILIIIHNYSWISLNRTPLVQMADTIGAKIYVSLVELSVL